VCTAGVVRAPGVLKKHPALADQLSKGGVKRDMDDQKIGFRETLGKVLSSGSQGTGPKIKDKEKRGGIRKRWPSYATQRVRVLLGVRRKGLCPLSGQPESRNGEWGGGRGSGPERKGFKYFNRIHHQRPLKLQHNLGGKERGRKKCWSLRKKRETRLAKRKNRKRKKKPAPYASGKRTYPFSFRKCVNIDP